ncbi:MAG: hypothetical protein CMK32_13105 [Porticoccaceae bacterium]|nr:hypothetical protein [Porticoccaceae bacterium]
MTVSTARQAPAIPSLDPERFVDVDLFGADFKADVAKWFLEWAEKPPFYVMVDGRPNAVICRHEQVKAAFADYETFSVVPQPGWGADYLDYFDGLPVIIEIDPPEHARLRRLMQPAFSPRRMSQMQAGIDQLVEEMIEAVSGEDDFDIVTEFAQPLVLRLLLGTVFEFPPEDWHIFTNYSRALELVATVPPGAPKPQAYREAFQAAHQYCEMIIEERRRQPKDDLVGTVVAAHDDHASITTEELFGILVVLFTGGLGTASSMIGLCMLRLCRSPDQMKMLQDDITLVPPAVEECLRIDALGTFRHRYVMKDCVIDGVPLYRGMIAHLSMAGSNYDPAFYPEPDKFDIKRNPRDISTFGHGDHFCIGHRLTRAVLCTVVRKLVTKFPRVRLSDPDRKVAYGGLPTERMPLDVRLRLT